MRHCTTRCLLALALLACLSSSAEAELITYTTRPAFNAAAPGLPVETFESGLVSAGGLTLCSGPVSNAAGGTCFPTGGLLPGVIYASSANVGPELVVLGAGFIANTSKVLGPNFFIDTFNLTFANANAIGLDLFPGPAAGNVLVSVFDPGGSLAGTFSISAPTTGTFFGVVSTTGAISRINIASQAPTPGELIDNVAFGNAAPIPEPASILLLGTGLTGAGLAVKKRRKAKNR